MRVGSGYSDAGCVGPGPIRRPAASAIRVRIAATGRLVGRWLVTGRLVGGGRPADGAGFLGGDNRRRRPIKEDAEARVEGGVRDSHAGCVGPEPAAGGRRSRLSGPSLDGGDRRRRPAGRRRRLSQCL